MARFCPLFSGSSGNAYLIGGADGNILVDIGVSAKKIENALKNIGVSPESIHTIFITHEHTDHVSGLRVFASRYGSRVCATEGTMRALYKAGHLQKIENIRCISYGEESMAAGITVKCFKTPHDSVQSCGYRITTPDGRKIGIATDIGVITEEVAGGIYGCDMVVLESNHDVRMLQNSSYPYHLKVRILSEKGHLSNDSCARELVKLVKNGTTRIILGHLSRENNFPELAYTTSLSELSVNGMKEKTDFLLKVAGVQNLEPVVVF